jgi:pimeloyl-ACP methyl ester carboxylesterase
MATFVLVPGAWMGAWVWKPVTQRLRGLGHEVYPLSLTGMGERIHLAQPSTNLDTHISDVLNLLRYEDLSDVVLVGHSYAGLVVTGVANRTPTSLSCVVYCDTLPFPNGMRMVDMNSPEGQEELRRTVDNDGAGWLLPFPGFPALGTSSSVEGLGPAEQELMTRKAAPQPFETWTQPLELDPAAAQPPPYRRALILCRNGQQMLEAGIVARFVSDLGDWRVERLDTGHWPMLSQPDALSTLLDNIAS